MHFRALLVPDRVALVVVLCEERAEVKVEVEVEAEDDETGGGSVAKERPRKATNPSSEMRGQPRNCSVRRESCVAGEEEASSSGGGSAGEEVCTGPYGRATCDSDASPSSVICVQ